LVVVLYIVARCHLLFCAFCFLLFAFCFLAFWRFGVLLFSLLFIEFSKMQRTVHQMIYIIYVTTLFLCDTTVLSGWLTHCSLTHLLLAFLPKVSEEQTPPSSRPATVLYSCMYRPARNPISTLANAGNVCIDRETIDLSQRSHRLD